MKPIIGVLPLWDDEKKSIWMLPEYFEGIKVSGGIPMMLPLKVSDNEIEQLSKHFDGFLFTGGHDVDSRLYNEKSLENTIICSERDYLEKRIFSIALRENKSVLGICRGIQIINVLLGGSLYQDIPAQCNSNIEHHMTAPYDRACHSVNIINDSPLGMLLNQDSINVNSYHHQGIKSISKLLYPMAVSDDGLIEAVYMKSRKFIWAVQWHPEFSFKSDENSRKILKKFVDSCTYN